MQIFSKELLLATDDLHGLYEWTSPGTYSFKLSRRTRATIWIVGSGADRIYMDIMGTAMWMASGGGAAFIGGVILDPGTYSVTIGNNSGSTLTKGNITYITAGCWTTDSPQLNTGGGKLVVSNNLIVQSGTVTLESDGNGMSADGTIGGASLYAGYGKGSDSSSSNYTTGYFKIEY